MNRLIESQRLQKSKRSVRYVRQKVLGVCSDLIWKFRPRRDWRKREVDWSEFFQETVEVKDGALSRLDTIVDKYYYLLNAEMKNDIFDLIGFLESKAAWMQAYFPEKFLTEPNKISAMSLSNIIEQIAVVVSQASKIIKQHKLITGEGLLMGSTVGEAPKVERYTIPDIKLHREYQYSMYEKILIEIIEFRDYWHEHLFKEA